MSSSQQASSESRASEQTTLGGEEPPRTPPEKVFGKREGSMYKIAGPGVPMGVQVRIETVKPADSWERDPGMGTAAQANEPSDVWVEAYYAPIVGIRNGNLQLEGDLDDPEDDGTTKFGGTADLLLDGKVDWMPDGESPKTSWYKAEIAHP
jgi:hypothetical protein